jgi:hypothetical protein
MLPYTTLYYFINNKPIMLEKWLKNTLPLYYLFTTSKNNTTSILPFLPIYYLFVILIYIIINKVVQGSISMSQNMCLKLKLTRFFNRFFSQDTHGRGYPVHRQALANGFPSSLALASPAILFLTLRLRKKLEYM